MLEQKGIVNNATELRHLLCDKFSRAHLHFVIIAIMLSMIDCPLLQFLPWKDTQFYRESKGFPTLSLMKRTLGADAIQAASSVIIQAYYISTSVGLDEPTTSIQAKALFGLNISFSLIGITSALVTLCLKTTLLTRMENRDDDDSKYDQGKEELESDEVPKSVFAKGGGLSQKACRLSEIELETFYQSSETDSGKPGFTENPMLDASENMEEEKVNKSEYMKVVEANDNMKCDIVELRSENEAVRNEIETVRSDNEAVRSENEAVRSDNEALRNENDTLRIEIERLRGDAHSKANQGSTNE